MPEVDKFLDILIEKKYFDVPCILLQTVQTTIKDLLINYLNLVEYHLTIA